MPILPIRTDGSEGRTGKYLLRSSLARIAAGSHRLGRAYAYGSWSTTYPTERIAEVLSDALVIEGRAAGRLPDCAMANRSDSQTRGCNSMANTSHNADRVRLDDS